MRPLSTLEQAVFGTIQNSPGLALGAIQLLFGPMPMGEVAQAVSDLMQLGYIEGDASNPIKYSPTALAKVTEIRGIKWVVEEGEYNRVFKVNGLEILVNYTSFKNDGQVTDKAIKLDSAIIPAIKKGLRLLNDWTVAEKLALIVKGYGHNLNSTATREERSQFISDVINLYNFQVIEMLTGKKVTDPRETATLSTEGLPPCPSCGSSKVRLSFDHYHPTMSFHVICFNAECALSGPYGKDEQDATRKWIKMPR